MLWPPDVKNQLIGIALDAGKDCGQEEKRVTEDEMVGCHHQLNGSESEQILGYGEEEGSLKSCSPWGHKESNTTKGLNNNFLNMFVSVSSVSCELTVSDSLQPMNYSTTGLPIHHQFLELVH